MQVASRTLQVAVMWQSYLAGVLPALALLFYPRSAVLSPVVVASSGVLQVAMDAFSALMLDSARLAGAFALACLLSSKARATGASQWGALGGQSRREKLPDARDPSSFGSLWYSPAQVSAASSFSCYLR